MKHMKIMKVFTKGFFFMSFMVRSSED